MQAYQNRVDLKSEAPGTLRPRERNQSQPSGLLWLYIIIKWYTYAQNTFPPPLEKPNAAYRLTAYTHLEKQTSTNSPFTDVIGHRTPLLLRSFQICC